MNDVAWVGQTLDLAVSGALRTLVIALASVAVSVLLGTVLGMLLCLPADRWSGMARSLLTGYLQLFRGLPVLVTLFIVFFVSPSLGLQLASGPAAVVGLSLWGSANVMEVVRGAIRSTPKAQFEAAFALGFPWILVMRLVILPQATMRMLPPTVNLTVDLIQATTLASLIGVVEVLQKSRQAVEYFQLSAGNGHAAPVFAGVLLFFFLICYPLTVLARRIERRSGEAKTPEPARPSPSASSPAKTATGA